MMSVLITGAGGFIGRRVVRTMRESGYDVRPMVRTDRGDFDCAVIRHDLRNPLSQVPPVDWIFHLAGAYAGAGDAELEAADLMMAHNILLWGLENGVKNWVFASAAEVYGNVRGVASEDANTAPMIPYGRIKLRIERLFMEALKNVAGYRLVIFRIGEVYGSEGRLITELTGRLRRGFCPWPGNGNVPVSFVHVEDVARAFKCAAEKSSPGLSLFNVADDTAATWREFLTSAALRTSFGSPTFLPLPVVQVYAACSACASRLTGQEPVLTGHALRLITTPKRLANACLKRDLGFELRYPSFLEGMEEALRGVSHDR